jgi:hypothetical protein
MGSDAHGFIDAGAPLSHPEILATAVGEFIGFLDGAPTSSALVNVRFAGSA